jgi:predicted NBD/HSP70 family sugar kinase
MSVGNHRSSESSTSGYVVGVDIGGTNLRLGLARSSESDRPGAFVARWSALTVGIRNPDAIVELIRSGVEELLRQAAVPRSELKAIAVGAPGITNFETGVVIVPSYLLGWRDVPLRTMLEDSFEVPAAVDNDVNFAALGESWAGVATGKSDFVFLAIGTGLAAGIFLNGNLFRGSGWTAGEIGYMLLPGLPAEPAARGKPGGLESVLGGEGIKAQWQARWSEAVTPLSRELQATEIFDHAQQGDALANTILLQSSSLLASAIYNISLALDCPLFVLGGSVGLHSALCQAAQNVLVGWGTRVQPRLVLSSLGADAQLCGAIRQALSIIPVDA